MPATATTPQTNKLSATSALLTPHLVCRDASGAIEFYRRAFGADVMRVVKTPDGGVLHAALRVRGAMFFLCDEAPQFGSRSPRALGGTPVTLALHVHDCDAVFDRAVKAGCEARMPPQDMFWGDRYGVLTDPYGHAWSVATRVREVSDDEMQRGAAACAEAMKKEADGCPGATAR
jgi:uncharacterized glyoxalase superfamily protein PhnB